MNDVYKRNLKLLAFIVVVLILLNFNFFWHQAKYIVDGKKTVFYERLSVKNQQQVKANYLTIESLNIQAPIIYIDEKTETVFQEALKNGAVHYPGTALPGEEGNCYIFGHSSDYIWSKGNYKNVFALLPKMEVGDNITVSNAAKEAFTYKVIKTVVVSPSQTEYLSQDTQGKKLLTIQTSYPLGTAWKRFLVIAEIE